MAKLIDITEEEMAALIDNADGENPVSLHFGPGRVAIDAGDPNNNKHMVKLAELRGVQIDKP